MKASALLALGLAIALPVAAQQRQVISPPGTAVGLPFSPAVRVGNMVYLSGQIGNRPGTRELADTGKLYATYFSKDPPARSTVAGSGLALGARVEIECLATAAG